MLRTRPHVLFVASIVSCVPFFAVPSSVESVDGASNTFVPSAVTSTATPLPSSQNGSGVAVGFGVGVAAVGALLLNSARCVASSAVPVALMPARFWNADTAFFVLLPYTPSV